MKIREGYGMTRDGRKVKIGRYGDDSSKYPFCHGGEGGWHHLLTANGKSWVDSSQDDIISMIDDAPPSPVRTVTRREIVPGEYGRIHVTGTYKGNRVTLDWTGNSNINTSASTTGLRSYELRSAAMVLSQLAEALDDMGDEE